eukprot:536373-Rhodomonas_salina.2
MEWVVLPWSIYGCYGVSGVDPCFGATRRKKIGQQEDKISSLTPTSGSWIMPRYQSAVRNNSHSDIEACKRDFGTLFVGCVGFKSGLRFDFFSTGHLIFYA